MLNVHLVPSYPLAWCRLPLSSPLLTDRTSKKWPKQKTFCFQPISPDGKPAKEVRQINLWSVPKGVQSVRGTEYHEGTRVANLDHTFRN